MRQARPRSTYSWTCSSCYWRLTPKRVHRGLSTQNHATSQRKTRVPEAPARTRFAPSPTGNLHLGSIRTALFNYLLAKRTKGQFLLRIEDTDQKRTIPGAEERLYRDLEWAGLQWDEGPIVGGPYGPYRQSERTTIYTSHIQPLLDSKHAYRCFCSPKRIDELNRTRHTNGLPLGYDRRCVDLSEEDSSDRAHEGHSHIIRFRVPEEYPGYNDFVYGKTGRGSGTGHKLHIDQPVYDDPVLIKSDGHPTYHFANVVDDHLMKITHVIRGSEWMSSTPLHIVLYNAFGWAPPAFGHVPLLVNEKGQKLSKRNFDSDISTFRDRGEFPDALVNFAALLGWSHQQASDVMNLKELESVFDLKFTKGNTIVSMVKLEFLQRQHARRYMTGGAMFEQMVRDVVENIEKSYDAEKINALVRDRSLEDVVALMLRAESNSYSSPTAFAKRCSVFFDPPLSDRNLEKPATFTLQSLATTAAALCLVPAQNWTAEAHRHNLAALQIPPARGEGDSKTQSKAWRKEFYHFLRQALLDGASGPSIPETMEVLGKDICTERIQAATMKAQSQEAFETKPNIKWAVV